MFTKMFAAPFSSFRRASSSAKDIVELSGTFVGSSKVSGEQPPIVMLHGILGASSTYASVMRRPDYAPSRRKIGVDLRNHGSSPHTVSGMRYEQMASDVSAFLHKHNINKACLIGHSMGGKVAMQLALQEPELVSELVVVDIAPVTYEKAVSELSSFKVITAMQAVDFSKCRTREQVSEVFKKYGVTSEQLRNFAMTNLNVVRDKTGSQTFKWRLNLAAIAEEYSNLASFPDPQGKVYHGRTCVIRGGRSNYVPFSAMRGVTSLFPNCKLVTLSSAGHWLQAEDPDGFCDAVNAFLSDSPR